MRENDFTRNTYDIVSKVAYLIGVTDRIFMNEVEPPLYEIYEELNEHKNLRVIRNLSIIRTAILRHYDKIDFSIRYDLKNLHSLPEYVPQEAIKQLEKDGIVIIKANCRAYQYLDILSSRITERLSCCKGIFPIWISWDYIKELFYLPKKQTERKLTRSIFRNNLRSYPYQMYINWEPVDEGNILYNDKKFVELLYRIHGQVFEDISKVRDASAETKHSIYDFLDASQKTVFLVDCENSDPYKLSAVLKNLDEEACTKITEIILYDDPHTAIAWRILESFTRVPIQHVMVDRVKQAKSLVDMRLAAGACEQFYKYGVDSFILVSSDSDYWGLISSLDARFLVMAEVDKCGVDIKHAMYEKGIFYCFIDDFCTGNADQIKMATIMAECRNYLNSHVTGNIYEMLSTALRMTRAEMTESEKKQFIERSLKTILLKIEDNGKITIQIGQ